MTRTYFRDQRGSAAVEFVLVLAVFALALPSVVDGGIYAYRTMQVRNSAQAGVQAIWAACTQLPATSSTTCPTAKAALTQAVQRTSLGAAVTVADNQVVEGYYCTNSSGDLANAAASGNTGTLVSGSSLSTTVPSPPGNCNAVTSAKTTAPGQYIWVTASYTFTPVFGRISVFGLLNRTIRSTAWMRLI